MRTSAMLKKIISEISKIPDEKVPEIFDIISNVRLGLVVDTSNTQKILQFAGS